MVNKIYIARHGFRLNWVTTTWKSKTGLPRDPPLAAYGETQAQELGAYFASLPESERPTAIFSSPYYRCLQTAQPVAKALGLPIYVEHGVAEWYSPVTPGTGLHPRPGSAVSLQEFFPEVDPSWSTVWYPSRLGEDVPEIHDRADGFLSAFLPTVDTRFSRKHERILLVSHAATVIVLGRSLLRDRNRSIRVGCCSLSEFVHPEQEGAPWQVVKLADGAHLVDGAAREWGFEDIEIAHGKVVDDPGEPGSPLIEDGPVGSQVQLASNL